MTESGSFGLSVDTLGKMRAVFKRYPTVTKVIVYGSRAKGTYKPGSDIDLALVGDKLELEALLKIQGELEDLLIPYQIDLCLHKDIDNPQLLDHIQRVGKTFYP
jgi:predicted nucleotidyltransferase